MTRRLTRALPLLALLVGAGPAMGYRGASGSYSIFLPRYAACSKGRELDVRCLGAAQGQADLVAALRALPRHANPRHRRKVSRMDHAARLAALFNLRAAVGPLRQILALTGRPAERGTAVEMSRNRSRGEAALALAALGDRGSAMPMVRWLQELETQGHGTLWEDVLRALGQLDPHAAGAYVHDLLQRQRPATLKDLDHRTLEALPYLVAARRRQALPILRRLTAGDRVPMSLASRSCRVMAVRMELGDDLLRRRVKRLMAGSYSGTQAATCDGAWLTAAHGDEPADAATLVRHLGRPDLGIDFGVTNRAYLRVLHLLGRLRGDRSRAAKKARTTLRQGLAQRARWPHLAQPKHRSYSRHFVALHRAAQAALGDARARRQLYAIIDDPLDATGVPWLAALHAVRLGLPGAMDHAARLAARALHPAPRERGSVMRDIRTRLLDEMVAVGGARDVRWAVLVLNGQAAVRERALYHLARHRSPAVAFNVCGLVTRAARQAEPVAVDDGLFSLSVFGGSCRPALEALAQDPQAPGHARGMALEMLATIGAPLVPQLTGRLAHGKSRPYAQRARRIYRAVHAAGIAMLPLTTPPAQVPPHPGGSWSPKAVSPFPAGPTNRSATPPPGAPPARPAPSPFPSGPAAPPAKTASPDRPSRKAQPAKTRKAQPAKTRKAQPKPRRPQPRRAPDAPLPGLQPPTP